MATFATFGTGFSSSFFSANVERACVNHLWQTTVVVLLAWALTLCFRSHHARLRYGLWMAASAKFLIPFSLLVSVGQMIHPRVIAVPQNVSVNDVVMRSVQPYAAAVPNDVAAPWTVVKQPSRRGYAGVLALCLWGAGALCVAGSWLRTRFALGLLARRAKPWGERGGVPVRMSDGMLEPGVLGMVRPVILMPKHLLERLTAAEIEAIFAHELAHVRRRDNLAAAFHSLVLALFWFHPMAWLVRARLLDERERVCDELVVAAGNDAEVYARSILHVCSFCVEVPAQAMAGVTGGELKQRVLRIVDELPCTKASGAQKAMMAALVIAVLCLPLVAGVLMAQSAEEQGILLPPAGKPLPEFAVATVKPAQTQILGAALVRPGGRVEFFGATFEFLMMEAFHASQSRIQGGPAWVKDEHAGFDIVAVPPDDSQARQYNPSEMKMPMIDEQRLMLQALLRERFGLKYHVEKSDQPVLFLRRTDKSLKLLPPKDTQRTPYMHVRYFSDGSGNGEVLGMNTTMAYTALQLGTELRIPVIDQTGINGSYDFEVPGPGGDVDARDAASDGLLKLGLELKPGKAPVDTIVIDAVQKPAQGQEPVAPGANAPAKAFEVATVRPSQFTPGCLSISPPGSAHYTLTCVDLRVLIAMAYGVDSGRVEGPEKEIGRLYDINASTGDRPWQQSEIGPMLQTLLAERFHLQVHVTERPVSGYELVVAKGGPKLTPTVVPNVNEAQAVHAGQGSPNFIARGLVQGTAVGLRGVASLLSGPAGGPVVDHTGLGGVYDVRLHFAPEDDKDSDQPSFFSAVEEQLGLKLQPAKVPAKFLVVDHVDTNPSLDQ